MSVTPVDFDVDAIEREVDAGAGATKQPAPPSDPAPSAQSPAKTPEKKGSVSQRIFGFATQRKDSMVGQNGWKQGVGYGPGAVSKSTAVQPKVMSKEERMALQEKEIAAFKKMDEDVDLEGNLSPCKTKTLKYADHPCTEIFMMFLTAFALYGADINNAYGNRHSDDPMGILNFITMMIFLIELGVMSYARPKFFGRVPFWLDLLAAISLIGDIPFFASELLPSGFAAARAGRAARAGTKAGRLVRLIRLTRLVRLTRLTRVQKHMARKGRKSIVEELGTEEEKRIIAQARAKMAGKSEGDAEKAGAIAQQISTRTIKKVIIGVLIMLLMMPYLEADRPDMSKFSQLVQLHNVASDSDHTHMSNPAKFPMSYDNTTACFNTATNKQQHLLNLTMQKYLVEYPDLFFLRINGITYINDQAKNATLRPSTEVGVSYWPDEILVMSTTPTVAAFSIRAQFNEDAIYSIYTTTFVIGILIIGMIAFNKDSSHIAKLITDPLSLLSDDMALVSNMVLRSPIEHVPSEVNEIRSIQVSFLKMKYGLGSFAKYVPYEVVRQMMSKGEEAVLGVTPKEVTIFFSDIAGFTTICEAMKPNELLVLLSDYFAAMSAIIVKGRGTLLEFIGDALLVVWNAPQDVADHAYQTVEGAIQMNEYLAYMEPKWTALGYPPINIRSGIHTATVFVGNIGSPDRMKYGVLGDGVNLASRLEELNKRYKTKIMISINTEKKKKVQTFFLTRPLDLVAVKGKTTGTAVFEVLGRRKDVDERIRNLAKLQKDGFAHYYAREFEAAVASFDDAGKQWSEINAGGNDAAAALLKGRCTNFVLNPPPEGWNGCEVLNQKHF